ncbi:hypothetical protein V6N13_090562 [Hibiscus sabdariffa]
MVKFQLKKVLCMGVAIGNVVMEEKQIFKCANECQFPRFIIEEKLAKCEMPLIEEHHRTFKQDLLTFELFLLSVWFLSTKMNPFFVLRTLYSRGSKFGQSCKGAICGPLLDGSIIRKVAISPSVGLTWTARAVPLG